VKGIRESYFGWSQLTHAESCKRPTWDVDTKVEYDAWRPRTRGSDVDHRCRDEECGHDQRYTRTTVRIICRSCGQAYVVAGDERLVPTSTAYLGVGQQPRRLAGLLLWPGEPFDDSECGLAGEHDPYELLVTGPGVTRPRREDLVGEIAQSYGKRGALRYCAVRGLDPNGTYGHGDFRWTAAIEGLRSIPAAAKWIADRGADTTTSTSTTGDH
jgi:hypothetical protein